MSTMREPGRPRGSPLQYTRWIAGLLALLIASQLILTPVAFAASGRANGSPPLTTQGIVDLAGVSVVRLVISYKSTATTCTALGTIIASWPALNSSDKNNWVLTDASMLLPTTGSCQPGGKLAGIQIYASSEYAGTQSPLPLDQLTCLDNNCSDIQPEGLSNPSVGGGILFSFHSDKQHMQPFLGLAPPAATTSSSTGVELTNSNGVWPSLSQIPKITGTNNPTDFLTPHTSATPSGAGTATAGTVPLVIEPGTPYVDSNGNVTGIQVLGTTTHLSVDSIQTLEKQENELQQPTLAQNLSRNTLNSQWQIGMQQYEQGKYAQAAQTFHNIQTLNPTFQAAGTFETMANQRLALQNATPTATATANRGLGNQGGSTSTNWSLIVGLVAGGLALVLLFLLVGLQFGRKRVERKRELESSNADVKRVRQRVAISPPAVAQVQNIRPAANAPPVPQQPRIDKAPLRRNSVQPPQTPKMQDDLVIEAKLERLWERASR